MIENELKYVLHPALYDLVMLGDYPELTAVPARAISQFYHERGGRLRSDSDYANGINTCTFNYKLTLPSGETEEFEMEVDGVTYDRAIKGCDTGLEKIRYSVPDGESVWDVDFFIDPTSAHIYFAMAECEMPTGQEAPDRLPSFITDHLILSVPRDQWSVYSSRKMTSVKYANERLEELLS